MWVAAKGCARRVIGSSVRYKHDRPDSHDAWEGTQAARQPESAGFKSVKMGGLCAHILELSTSSWTLTRQRGEKLDVAAFLASPLRLVPLCSQISHAQFLEL